MPLVRLAIVRIRVGDDERRAHDLVLGIGHKARGNFIHIRFRIVLVLHDHNELGLPRRMELGRVIRVLYVVFPLETHVVQNLSDFSLWKSTLTTHVLGDGALKAHTSEDRRRLARLECHGTRAAHKAQVLVNEFPKVNLLRLGKVLHRTRGVEFIVKIGLLGRFQFLVKILQPVVQYFLTILGQDKPVKNRVKPARATRLDGT